MLIDYLYFGSVAVYLIVMSYLIWRSWRDEMRKMVEISWLTLAIVMFLCMLVGGVVGLMFSGWYK